MYLYRDERCQTVNFEGSFPERELRINSQHLAEYIKKELVSKIAEAILNDEQLHKEIIESISKSLK